MKSPLKAKPLRNPGESLDHEIDDVLYDDILAYLLIALFTAVLAMLEWMKWIKDIPPAPKLYTFFAAIVALVAFIKVKRSFRKIKRLKLGRDGEKAVGQFLDKLRESGAEIFHDIPGEGFNLDHVVMHTTGIYVIETKTLSKPDRGEAKLIFDGNNIRTGSFVPDRNPIQQVRSASKWLIDLLTESTGRSFSVRPVVVYPGWFIQPTAEAKSSDVWVLNPRALPSFISNSAIQLKNEDVKLCSYHLSRYIRTTQR